MNQHAGMSVHAGDAAAQHQCRANFSIVVQSHVRSSLSYESPSTAGPIIAWVVRLRKWARRGRTQFGYVIKSHLRQPHRWLSLKNANPGGHDPRRGLCVIAVLLGLDSHYVGGLRALRAALDIELHLIAFFQVAKTLALDSRKVDEHIVAAFALNEAVALLAAKPLHRSGHSLTHWLVYLLPL